MTIERHYTFLKWTAIFLTMTWISWIFYNDGLHSDNIAGNDAYFAGNTFFEDGHYQRALQEYNQALQENPAHTPALRSKANTLIQLTRYQDALSVLNQLINQEPNFAGNYANRGILHDRMGNYLVALHDYETALTMDNSLAKGPDWLTRFFRLQADKPSTIVARALYLREQLAKPKDAQLLAIPDLDRRQLPYKK